MGASDLRSSSRLKAIKVNLPPMRHLHEPRDAFKKSVFAQAAVVEMDDYQSSIAASPTTMATKRFC